MRKFFRQLFCKHKFKYTKLDELIIKSDGTGYKKTHAECVYCGKVKNEFINT